MKNSKKTKILSLVAILILAGVGYGGYYAWQQHQSDKFNNKTHASSLDYVYGVVLRNDAYATIRACKWYDWGKHSFNHVSVLAIRNSPSTSSKYNIGATTAMMGLTSDRYLTIGGTSNHINYKASNDQGSWLWGTVALLKFTTVAHGHNYIDYASGYLNVTANGAHNTSGMDYNLVHRGAAGSQYTGRYVGITFHYPTRNVTFALPRTSDLPPCHY